MYGYTDLYSPRSVVLRQLSPSRTTRRERYTRSLSNPCLSLSTLDADYTTSVVPYKSSVTRYSDSITPLPTRVNKRDVSPLLTSRRLSSGIPNASKTSYATYALVRSSYPSRWWKNDVKEIALCTPDQLLDIIREPSGYYALPDDPYNEVYPGVFLSDAPTAMCTSLLKRLGITHVLNAAQGKMRKAGQVNTWPGFYSFSGIKFHGVEAFDNIAFRLYPYFEEAAHFIDDALDSGGKVLVHCRAGISRSATLVCAFLMLKRNMTAQEAIRSVRKNRAIIPNDGFLQQLCDLNQKLSYRHRNGEIL